MNRADADAWKSHVLDRIFAALAASAEIGGTLVFKGARVLNARLGGGRQSYDIDANLLSRFVERCPDREVQRAFLEREVARSVRRHFESAEPVRLELVRVRASLRPANAHPMGWDAFGVRVNVADLGRRVVGLPALDLDVAAPEELLESSVSSLAVGGHEVQAYTLERIAGEKLRAFLSSLPPYRAKVKKPGRAVRAKDLYDVAMIRRARDLNDGPFWRAVGIEFRLACRSRYIDCAGLAAFREQWDATRATYGAATIPEDISFAEAEAALEGIVAFFESEGHFPFSHPLPR